MRMRILPKTGPGLDQVSNKPIYDAKGEFIGMFSIGTDMTVNKAEEESIFLSDKDTLT